MRNNLSTSFSNFPKLRLGDWVIVIFSMVGIAWLFHTLWQNEPATKLRIRQGDTIYGTYSLNQTKTLHVHGKLGEAKITIHENKVRFQQSPCNNQYCVHQGWLNKAGQVAICLPNQLSIELLGAKKPFDTLNY